MIALLDSLSDASLVMGALFFVVFCGVPTRDREWLRK